MAGRFPQWIRMSSPRFRRKWWTIWSTTRPTMVLWPSDFSFSSRTDLCFALFAIDASFFYLLASSDRRQSSSVCWSSLLCSPDSSIRPVRKLLSLRPYKIDPLQYSFFCSLHLFWSFECLALFLHFSSALFFLSPVSSLVLGTTPSWSDVLFSDCRSCRCSQLEPAKQGGECRRESLGRSYSDGSSPRLVRCQSSSQRGTIKTIGQAQIDTWMTSIEHSVNKRVILLIANSLSFCYLYGDWICPYSLVKVLGSFEWWSSFPPTQALLVFLSCLIQDPVIFSLVCFFADMQLSSVKSTIDVSDGLSREWRSNQDNWEQTAEVEVSSDRQWLCQWHNNNALLHSIRCLLVARVRSSEQLNRMFGRGSNRGC